MTHKLRPTYVPFLDKLLGGGTAPTGVYGILGPTGVGKTHLASMIAINGATYDSVFQEACPRSFPWVLLDIETDGSMFHQRVLSQVAKVKRENIGHFHNKIQPYERERRAELPKQAGRLLSEADRLNHAVAVLVRQLHPLYQDHLLEKAEFGYKSKFSDFREWIAKSVAEFSSKKPLGGIVIDGVSGVWNYSQESSSMQEREFIQDFVDNFCRELTIREKCPVWITHQVNGTACRVSPLAHLSHQDAARCKTFARSLDACFVLGTLLRTICSRFSVPREAQTPPS